MSVVLALAGKELLLLVRDRWALFWILAFPLMFALFFGSIFGGGGGGESAALSLAIVDEDGGDAARALAAKLADHESLAVARTDADEVAAEDEDEVAAVDLASAREAVQKGRTAAYLRIPAGWGDEPWALFGAGGGEAPVLEIGIDPRRAAEAGFLQGVLMQAVFGTLQERFASPALLLGDLAVARADVESAADLDAGQKGVLLAFFGALESLAGEVELAPLGGSGGNGDGGFQPFEVVDVTRERDDGDPRSAFDITLPQAIVWGLMSVALTFAITLVRERTAGTLLRLRMAPIGHVQLLAGKALGCFAACMATMVSLVLVAAVALGVRFDSVPLLALAMVCTAVCFTGLMMTISVLGKTESAVAGSSWGLMMPLVMIGGGMIPLIAMPGWLRTASHASPFKWAITAVEGAVWRGFELADMLLPCAILVGCGALFFAIGVAVYRRAVA